MMIDLSYGRLSARLAPAVGGSLARFRCETGVGPVDLLRPAPDGFQEVRQAACFPLVPFSNRIREGRFDFRGQHVALPPNMPGQRHPLHGLGWRGAWTVNRRAVSEATLAFAYPGGDWPWPFSATQHFALDRNGLAITLALRNLGTSPMPGGLGFHPYFLCDPDTRIATEVRQVWLADEDILPTERVPATGRYALEDRAMYEQSLDNGYEDWSGEVTIDRGDVQLAMRSSGTHFFQAFSPKPGAGLYVPPGWGVFAVEPVTHANAALNRLESEWGEAGIRILEPGEEMSLTVRFDLLDGG